MIIRGLLISLLLSSLGGCGDPDVNVVARIQWRLNYKDWTDSSAELEDQFRDCTNQPESRYAGVDENPYPAITKVRVFIEDPEGQVPNAEKEFNCEDGLNSGTVDILSMVRQEYTITVEGKDAEGTVLYRHIEEEVDLSILNTHSYELKTVTSEALFFPVFEDDFNCPGDVARIRVSFFKPEDENDPEASPAFQYTSSRACSSGLSDQIYVRSVPVSPTEGSNGKYNPTTFNVQAEALSQTDELLHCGRTSIPRAFRPGDNTNGILLGNINLTPGPCP